MKKRSERLKFTILLLLIFFFIPLIVSQVYDLKIPTNETSCNVTISFLNSTNLIENQETTINVGYANYTLNLPLNGDYYYYSNCGFGTFNQNGELTTGTGLIYFLVTLFAFSIFCLLMFLFVNITGENPRDETGGYLGINYKKYLKTALFPLVYVSFLWFFNFIIGLSNTYLGLTLYVNTLGFIFEIMIKLVYPVVVVTIIWELVLIVRDNNIKREYKSLWSRF